MVQATPKGPDTQGLERLCKTKQPQRLILHNVRDGVYAICGAPEFNDTVDPHPRFFTEDECHAFKERRTIPERTLVFAARFTGRSLDSNGVDFTLTEPGSGELMVRAHVYNVMVGHVVLQVLSSHPEPLHKGKIIRFRVAEGPWAKLTIQIWPIKKKSVNWPPPISLSTVLDVTHYGNFRMRFRSEKGHLLVTPKPKAKRSHDRP